MAENESTQPPAAAPLAWLTEDWLATSLGIIIVLVLGLGVLGSGPQDVALSAGAGSDAHTGALAQDGWRVSATLGDEAVEVMEAPGAFEEGEVYVFVCQEGRLHYRPAIEAADYPDPDEDKALLVMDNRCDDEVSLTFSTEPAVRWPIFDIFD
jgi:hypothetical protein